MSLMKNIKLSGQSSRATKEFFEKRERELIDDLTVLEGYIKSFWEILPVPVCITNPLFIILETGTAFNRLFGYSKDEVVGEFLDILFQREDDFKKISQKLLREKKISDFEKHLKTKKGEALLFLVSAIAREDENADIVGYLFSFVDITLIKRTERELREKVEELERINKLMIGRELKMVELKEALRQAQAEVDGLKQEFAKGQEK